MKEKQVEEEKGEEIGMVLPLLSEFINDTVTNSLNLRTNISKTSKERKRKRKEVKASDSSSEDSDENDEFDHNNEQVEKRIDDIDDKKEEMPAWLRYLPPRRFIKGTVPKLEDGCMETRNVEDQNNYKTTKSSLEKELSNENKRKRMKYSSNTATEAAALLSFFHLKTEE